MRAEDVIKNAIYESLDDCLNSLMINTFDVKTGDVSPMQSLSYDSIIDLLTDLFTDIIQQNGGIEN